MGSRPSTSRAATLKGSRFGGSFSTGREGFALARVDTNMIRASSRSAVSHLHVVASQPATMPDDAPLIERAVELGVLAGAVRRLADGEGGVVVLDAPAGLGKTALLERAALFAADSGCLVRRAAPGPLERHFPFGVVRALLEAPLREASGEGRAQLLDGAASAAGTLLLEGTVPGGDSTMLLAHSVLWLCAAHRRPAAAGTRRRRRAMGRPLVAGGARLPRAAHRRPAAADRGRRARRRPARRFGSAEPARRRAVGHRAASPAPDAPRRDAADPPPGAGGVGGRLSRLPSRRRRQSVAAGRARAPDRHARPGLDRPGRRRGPARLRDRPQRHPLAAGRR